MRNRQIEILDSPTALAQRLKGRRLVSAEFMYKLRPAEETPARRVFDFTLASRQLELSRHENAALLLICDSPATLDSLAHLPVRSPDLPVLAAFTNSAVLVSRFADPYAETPSLYGWHNPTRWRRYALTDRWARITYALDVARQMPNPGYLIMPAHDAVWGRGLLANLLQLSEQFAINGLPAAVSPYTPHHHSPVPGVEIPPEIIAALNAAFSRDSLLRLRLSRGEYQAFWGKMGMIPFGMAAPVLDRIETMVWEDDLEIDRAIREAGYAVRAQWIGKSALYRQALPVFDRTGLRAVIERTLHYSLNIPGDTSILTRPLDAPTRLKMRRNPRFAQAIALAEAVTAECQAEIAARLKRYGASWVDWGAYRYVVRVGDPMVRVWKYENTVI